MPAGEFIGLPMGELSIAVILSSRFMLPQARILRVRLQAGWPAPVGLLHYVTRLFYVPVKGRQPAPRTKPGGRGTTPRPP